MQKLVFINGAGKEIDLTSGNFGITNWDGLSNVPLNIQTQQVPFEDGGVYLDALMEPREIDLTLAIYDGNNLEIRYQKKRELISALNPKLGEGILIYTNDYLSKQIHAVPQIPLFENKNSNDPGTLKASIAFTCPNPYWEDLEETVVDIGFSTEINNEGDVPLGIEADIVSTEKDFELSNISQNKKITIKDNGLGYFRLNTNVGKKRIEKGFVNYQILGSWCRSAFYDKKTSTTLFGSEGGFVSTTNSDFSELKALNINVDKATSQYAFRDFCRLGDYIYCVEDEQGVFRSKDLINWSCVYNFSIYQRPALKVTENGILCLYYWARQYSSDGVNWNNIAYLPNETNIHDIIYVSSKNKYYAVGDRYIASSVDLSSWTIEYESQTTPFAENFTQIFYNPKIDTFLIVGNITYSDPDSYFIKITQNFSSFTTIYESSVQFSDIKEVDGILFLTQKTSDSERNYKFFYSEDWSVWNDTGIEDEDFYLISSFKIGSNFYAVGTNTEVVRSNNLSEWEIAINDRVQMFGDGMAQVLSNGEIMFCSSYGGGEYSFFILKENGFVTKSISFTLPNGTFSFEYFNNKYFILENHTGNLYESSDGKSYSLKTSITLGSGEFFMQMYKVGDKLVITGFHSYNRFFLTSDDAENWQRVGSEKNGWIKTKPILFHDKWYCILYQENIDKTYIAVSEDGLSFTNEIEIISSIDSQSTDIRKCGNTLVIGYGTYDGASEESKGFVVYEKEGNSEWVTKNFNIYIGYVQNTIKQGDKYYAFDMSTTFGLIEIYSENGFVYNKKPISNQLADIMYAKDGRIFVTGYSFCGYLLDYKTYENCINKLTEDSDMSLGLNIGKNILQSNTNGLIKLKYRQRYIGV